jgi:transposase-like protein
MDQCPKCLSSLLIKDGVVGGRQRYLCKACGYHPTVVHKRNNLTCEEKEMALGMRQEGLGFRAIGRILKASHVSILKLVRSHGIKPNPTQQNESQPPAAGGNNPLKDSSN